MIPLTLKTLDQLMLLYTENVSEDKNTCLCFDTTDELVLFLLSFLLPAFSIICSACKDQFEQKWKHINYCTWARFSWNYSSHLPFLVKQWDPILKQHQKSGQPLTDEFLVSDNFSVTTDSRWKEMILTRYFWEKQLGLFLIITFYCNKDNPSGVMFMGREIVVRCIRKSCSKCLV